MDARAHSGATRKQGVIRQHFCPEDRPSPEGVEGFKSGSPTAVADVSDSDPSSSIRHRRSESCVSMREEDDLNAAVTRRQVRRISSDGNLLGGNLKSHSRLHRAFTYISRIVSAERKPSEDVDTATESRPRTMKVPGLVAWASSHLGRRLLHNRNQQVTGAKRPSLGRQISEQSDDSSILSPCRDGQIQFDGGISVFCTLPHTSDPMEFTNDPVYKKWNIKKPNLIMSIMGGAGFFGQDSSKYDGFKQDLVSAAMKTGAWILTGGTASGVMDLVGKAMQLHDKQRQVPLVGVTPFGALTESWREAFDSQLLQPNVEEVDVEAPDPHAAKDPHTGIPLANLQPNHTHFILCKSEQTGSAAFGTEVAFRNKLETHLVKGARGPSGPSVQPPELRRSRTSFVQEVVHEVINSQNCEVPRVMLLLNGGSISFESVDVAVRSGCPVVCVQGSGRAADAIVTLLEEDGTEEAALEYMTNETLRAESKEKLWRIAKSNRVQVYRSDSRLEDVILRAVLDNPSSDSEALGPRELLSISWHRLVLAVQWRSEGYYQKLLEHLIKHCRTIDPHQAGMNLVTQLLFTGFVGEKRVDIIHSDQGLGPLDRGAGPNIVPLLELLIQNHKSQLDKFRIDEVTLGSIEWKLNNKEPPTEGLPGLLVWAVEQEAPEIVLDSLWMHTPDPIHAALVAASACRHIAEVKHSYKSYSNVVAKKRLESIAERFEKLAVQALEDLATANVISPVDYLFEPSHAWKLDCFHMAIELGCKDFVSSKFYRMAVDTYYKTPAPFSKNRGRDNVLQDLDWISVFLVATNIKKSNLAIEKFYRVPYIKAMTHAISRIVFIVVYAHAVFSGCFITRHTHWIEGFLFVFGLSLARIEYKQYAAKKSFSAYIDFWNGLDCLHITVLLFTIVVGQFLKDSSNVSSVQEYGVEVVHAINLLPSFMRLLQVFQLSEYFGTLVLTVAGMVTDATYFFVLLAIFCMMFSCALTPILFQQVDARQKQGLTWAFWSIFGDINQEARDQLNGEWRCLTLREFAHGLLYLLCLVSNVLLMNLLIAVMGSTYDRNKENSETEWAFNQATAWTDFDEDVSMLPPPLNLLEDIPYFADVVSISADVSPLAKSTSLKVEAYRSARNFDIARGPSSADLMASAKKAIAALNSEGELGSELAESLKKESEDLKRQNCELRRLADLEKARAEELEKQIENKLAAKKAAAALHCEREPGSELVESLKRETEDLKRQNSELRRLADLEKARADELGKQLENKIQGSQVDQLERSLALAEQLEQKLAFANREHGRVELLKSQLAFAAQKAPEQQQKTSEQQQLERKLANAVTEKRQLEEKLAIAIDKLAETRSPIATTDSAGTMPQTTMPELRTGVCDDGKQQPGPSSIKWEDIQST